MGDWRCSITGLPEAHLRTTGTASNTTATSTQPPSTAAPPIHTPTATPLDPLPPQGPAPSGVSQVDAVKPVEVAVDSGAARGAEPVGAGSGGAESGGAEPGGAESGGADPGGAEPERAEPGGAWSGGAELERAEPEGAGSGGAEPWVAECGGAEPDNAGPGGPSGASSRPELPSPQELREWFARRWSRAAGAGGAAGAGVSTAAGGAGATGPGGAHPGGTGAAGPCGATRAGAVGEAGAGGAAGVGATGGTGARAAASSGGPGAAGAAEGTGARGAAGAGAPVGAGVGATGGARGAASARGAAGVGADAVGTGAVPAGSGGAARPRPYFVPLLEQVLGLPPSSGPAPSLECPPPVQSESQLQLASPLPAPSPYAGHTGGLAERCEPESSPASPVRAARTGHRVPRQRPPAVPGTHQMALRPSTAPQRVPLPSPPESSLPALADPESDSLRAASPTVTRLLATVVTDPSFESTAPSALVAELVDFAAHCRLDYAASLVAEPESVCPLSVGGECALSTDVVEDRQEEFQCFAAALPHLVSMLLAPEGDPDAPDIPTPRSYAEAIEGPYSSQWQSAMDAEMASWKSTGTNVDEVPPPGANIVSGMWIFRVKWPLGSPPVFKARYVARGFIQRQGVDYFQTFFPTPKMTTLRVLLHAPREWHDTLRTTLAALGFAPSTADPSLFLRTDTSLSPFYILVYVDDLVFAIADTAGLAQVKSELQKRHTCTDLGELRSYLGLQITRDRARRIITMTQSHMVQQVLQRFDFTYSSPQATPLSTRHSLSTLPSDESVEPSGPYPELVGCLIHRREHMAAAKRVLRYLCSTSCMGLVLGGRSPVVLTGHSDASWVDDLATQRSSQGYTFSLGSGSVSWRSSRSSFVLSSSCEAEIYAGAMAAQELRWLTYLLTDLGESPRSPPVLYVDNKAMLALCEEHRLQQRTKHIALRYFLARELQQRGQLRLAYVASQANTADIFTKALQPCDHQRFCTMLGLRLHSDRGGEFSSSLLRDFCRGECILQSFTLPDSPQKNGIAERRIGLVMEVAHTSMIHAAAPHFLWPFAVRYAAHQLNLWPRISLPETSPTLRWTGKVGNASVFRVWGSRAFVRDTSADKLSPRAIPCIFLGFVPDAPGWQFYHPRCVFPSHDVTFDESVPFYCLFPYRSASPPPPPLFLAPGTPPVDPLPPQGPAPSGVSQVDPLPRPAPVEVAVGSSAARGAASGGAASGGAEPEGAGSEGAGSAGAEPVGEERGGAEPEGVEPEGAESGGAEPRGAASSGDAGAGGGGVTAGGGGGTAANGPGGALTRDTGAAGAGGVEGAGAGVPTEPGAAGPGGPGAGGAGAGGTGAAGAGAIDPGAGGAGDTMRPRPYFVPLLQQVLGVPSSTGLTPHLLCPPPDQSQLSLQPASPLPAPSPYIEQSGGLTERRKHASRTVSPARTTRCVPHSRPPPVPGTHGIALRPSSVPLRVPLPAPFESSLPEVPDPKSDRSCAASPIVARLLATAVIDPSIESTAASALVAELLDFATAFRLDYATALVVESASASPPSVGGECALGTDVLEDKQEDFECLATAVPRFASMLLAPEGDPDAPITGPYFSQWLAAMDAEMASWKSTGTYVDEVPLPGANIVNGMWIFRVKRPPGSPPVFKARYVAQGFNQRQGVDYFQTFSPTPKITTLRVLLHVAAQRDYELHSLDFSTTFLQGNLHEEIWLCHPPCFTESFPAALGFSPATADPSLFLRTDTLLPPFYVLVYIDDLVFATADTEALTLVKLELQKRHTCIDLGELRSYLGLQITRDRARHTITLTHHSLSAPPSDESVEPSGPYPELVGCLMYLKTCIRPDLAYPLSLLACYVAPGGHRKVHWDAAKRVLRYLCSTLGMGLVLGGRVPVVLTSHADASWELRWLTYLLTDLGEQPCSPPILYVDNKAMIALRREHMLEYRTKLIALRYFLARELQQRGQLRLAYVATRANTADIFTKALLPGDHQRFSIVLGLVPTLPQLLTA
ncbi:unnamed protein product [Closterium sp. NIES-54]